MDDSTASRIVESVAEAGVTVMPLPATDLFLNGRGAVPPRFRGLSRVKDLIAGGANVAISSNNIRNAFTPSGNGDLLEVGLLLACTAHMSTVSDRALIPRFFTYNAAKALGIEDQYGIGEGKPADFVVFDTENFADLIIDQPEK
jgi:cytosine deaminase